jgi:hypothetical protein
MERSFTFPSVFEENYTEFDQVADNFLEGIKIVDFQDKDFIIGELALKEGNSPHKFLNSSADDLDYQLLGLTGILIATRGTYNNLIVTTGFPFSTFMPYQESAKNFFKGNHEIKFDARTLGGGGFDNVKFNIHNVDVMTEIDGCVKAIRDSEINEKDSFFIVSLGFGTFEMALSTPKGLIHRTKYSSKGMAYAVQHLENELQKKYYLNLQTEKQIEQAFMRGSIISSRKIVNIKDLRAEALRNYYDEVISPSMRKNFSDEDFLRSEKIYLTGGGALYSEMVDNFKREFADILDVIVPPEPNLLASKGYCLNSLELAHELNELDDKKSYSFVGIDLGNSNTVVTVNSFD